MSLIEPSSTMGPEPAAPADPNHTYADATGQSIETPQDVVVDTPPAEETEQETFDRKYVEELRRENAKWRTRTHEYEETFDGMEGSLREGWLELIRVAQSGDPEAMGQLAEMLGFEVEDTPQEPVVPTDAPQAITPDDMRAIAREEAQRLYEAEQSQRAEADAIQGVTKEASALGYDPSSMEYVQLLYLANEIDPSSLAPDQTILSAAHAQLQQIQQERFDNWVADKTAQAGGTPLAPSGNGASPSIASQPWDSNMTDNQKWAAVRESVDERFSNM